MQHLHGSKYFAQVHTLDPGVGSNGQTISFSESSHDAYQKGIKGNWAQSTMKANMVSLHTL